MESQEAAHFSMKKRLEAKALKGKEKKEDDKDNQVDTPPVPLALNPLLQDRPTMTPMPWTKGARKKETRGSRRRYKVGQ